MDGSDLYQLLWECMVNVDSLLEEKPSLGRKASEAERAYRIDKRKLTLYYHDQRYPATLVHDVVAGSEKVSDERFAWQCAQAEYDANQEAILWSKKKCDIYRELIAREYGR